MGSEKIWREWTHSEMSYIGSQYLFLSDHDLGLVIGRTRIAVKNKREKMGFLRMKGIITKPVFDKPKISEMINEITALSWYKIKNNITLSHWMFKIIKGRIKMLLTEINAQIYGKEETVITGTD